VIDIGTRKHGPFDVRYPRPSTGVPDADVERPGDWEWEGGQVGSRTHASGRENGGRPPKQGVLPHGLSWERFCALAYPGMRRHDFPAIAPWYRYRDGESLEARGPRIVAPER